MIENDNENLLSDPRPVTIIGNWKMNKTIMEAKTFVAGLAVATTHCSSKIGLAVPYTMIEQAAEVARGTSVVIGAQNVSSEEEGAFTGEISCNQLKDAGASFVIIGHSERRGYYHEDYSVINRKVYLSINSGLKVIMSIGEMSEQHQKGKVNEVLKDQLKRGLEGIDAFGKDQLMIAYEPLWAIGTNLAATPEVVQSVHHFCRQTLAKLKGENFAERVQILYGGSVKPDNAAELLNLPDVDGLLVGGASLSLDSFTKIIQCQQTYKSHVEIK